MTMPHVSLGNVESDIGSGTNTLINALNEQKKRQSQIALQSALQGEAQARSQELGAQTQDIAAQAFERQHMNEPAGPGEFGILGHLYPEIKPEIWTQSGITRGQADALTKSGLMITRLNMQQSHFNESQLTDALNKWRVQPEVQQSGNAATAYKNIRVLFNNPTAMTQPSILLNLGQMLSTTPNARAVGTELTNLLKGGGLAYTQRLQYFINKLTTEGDQFTMDPETLKAIPEIFRGVAKFRMDRYHQLRQDLKNQTRSIIGSEMPDDAIGSDPFGDIAPELQGVVATPLPGGPQQPTGPRLDYSDAVKRMQGKQ